MFPSDPGELLLQLLDAKLIGKAAEKVEYLTDAELARLNPDISQRLAQTFGKSAEAENNSGQRARYETQEVRLIEATLGRFMKESNVADAGCWVEGMPDAELIKLNPILRSQISQKFQDASSLNEPDGGESVKRQQYADQIKRLSATDPAEKDVNIALDQWLSQQKLPKAADKVESMSPAELEQLKPQIREKLIKAFKDMDQEGMPAAAY